MFVTVYRTIVLYSREWVSLLHPKIEAAHKTQAALLLTTFLIYIQARDGRQRLYTR